MTVKLVEDFAIVQVRKDIRDALQSVGEPAIILALRHPTTDASAERCSCHDDVYNDGESGCSQCYGTSFAEPIKEAARVWAVFTDKPDAENQTAQGTFTPDQRQVQTEGFPVLMEHDVIVRVRRWGLADPEIRIENGMFIPARDTGIPDGSGMYFPQITSPERDDGTGMYQLGPEDLDTHRPTPVEIEGFYGVQTVVVDSVRTGGRFGQYGWDIVGQKATVTRLSSSAPITRYPVVGEVFALPTIPPNGPLSSPRPHP